MKATGIVRRIDDLGRIVIPKEIRRTMRIREGDPLEIYTTRNTQEPIITMMVGTTVLPIPRAAAMVQSMKAAMG